MLADAYLIIDLDYSFENLAINNLDARAIIIQKQKSILFKLWPSNFHLLNLSSVCNNFLSIQNFVNKLKQCLGDKFSL